MRESIVPSAKVTRRNVLRAAGAGIVVAAIGGLAETAGVIDAAASQTGWRRCYLCEGLWFSGNGSNGHCPVGSGVFGTDHNHQSNPSLDYQLFGDSEGQPGQNGWFWCYACQGLWFGGNVGFGYCPDRGAAGHAAVGTGNYRLQSMPNPVGNGQNTWRFCYKCAGLWFFGDGQPASNTCPAGGAHSSSGSGDYFLNFV